MSCERQKSCWRRRWRPLGTRAGADDPGHHRAGRRAAGRAFGACRRAGGGLLPNVGSLTIGNLTGVLGYYLNHKLLGSGGAAGVLNGLTGRKGFTSSRDFALGQTGVLQTGSGALPLGNVQNTLRRQICDLILKQATRLL